MSDSQGRQLPELMQDIIRADRAIADLRAIASKTWEQHILLRDLLEERARMTAGAHRVYGHTPARGDRGPSSAGAMAA